MGQFAAACQRNRDGYGGHDVCVRAFSFYVYIVLSRKKKLMKAADNISHAPRSAISVDPPFLRSLILQESFFQKLTEAHDIQL
jgi:hypothetical protein